MAEGRDEARVTPSARRAELLEYARRQAAARRPVDLVDQWTRDSTVRPSAVDLRESTALDAVALSAAPDYDALLLSPVAPLGTSSVVAPTSQDRTLSTVRPTEVVSDPTNALALEAASRLRRQPGAHVRVCTLHQVLRMQPVADGPGRTRHFRLFALADAGGGLPDDGFEVEAVTAQLGVYRRVLDTVARDHGMSWSRAVAIVRTDESMPAIAARVAAALTRTQPDLEVRHEDMESSYYKGLRVGFGVHDRSGQFHEWGDLGCFDWVARLTGNRRQRFVASALGIQLLPWLRTVSSAPSR